METETLEWKFALRPAVSVGVVWYAAERLLQSEPVTKGWDLDNELNIASVIRDNLESM